MRARKRTREVEVALMSGTQDRDSAAAVQEGEDAEHHENQRHNADSTDQAPEPELRLSGSAIDWEIGEEGVEFTVGPGCEQSLKPLFKLILAEPPLSHRLTQPFGNPLPIGV